MSMKARALCFATVMTILTGCMSSHDDRRLTGRQYLEWLQGTMTETEYASRTGEFWERNVNASLKVRDAAERNIPEDIFRHFVLPVTTYKEDPDDFRMVYCDSLCSMVKGLGLEDATLKINHWCLSNATYGLHEGPWDSPRGTMARGSGSCEELSVFTASALRAAGIPARVVTARWTHVDGVHCWVEAWTGDAWKFLGACEPAGRLNESWVTHHAPKCAQITSIVRGDYRGPEPVVKRDGTSTVINVTGNYAPVREIVLTVMGASGKPVKGAHIEFKTYNSGALSTILEGVTDSRGCVKACFGTADIAVWAYKDGNYCLERISSDRDTICLDRSLGKYARIDLDMRPADQPVITTFSTDEEQEACDRQKAVDDSIRIARHRDKASEVYIESFKKICAVPVADVAAPEASVPGIRVRLTGGHDKMHKSSVSSVKDGRTIISRGGRVYRGPLLVVTGTRLADGTALVRAELLPSPEGGDALTVGTSFRSPGGDQDLPRR